MFHAKAHDKCSQSEQVAGTMTWVELGVMPVL